MVASIGKIASPAQGVGGQVHRSAGPVRPGRSRTLPGGTRRRGSRRAPSRAQGLTGLGYGIGKTRTDAWFEIKGVSREVTEAFSTRRAEIEATMAVRGMGESKDNPHLATRAALMTRATKGCIDRDELARSWQRQAKGLGFSASRVRAQAHKAERGLLGPDLFAGSGYAAGDAAAWAVGHLAERQSVFGHADLLAATVAREPGAVTINAALVRESETIALMRANQGAEKTVMRCWIAETKLHRSRLNEGQKEAAKTILASKDRVLGVQGYAGTGQTTMLKRLRALAASQSYRTVGLGGEDASERIRHRIRDPATLPRAPLRDRPRPGHGGGAAQAPRRQRPDAAGGGRVLARQQRTVEEPPADRDDAAPSLRGAGGRREAARGGRSRQGVRATEGRRDADRCDGRHRSPARCRAEGGGSGEPDGDVKGAFAKLVDNIRQVEYGGLGGETARRWLNLVPRPA